MYRFSPILFFILFPCSLAFGQHTIKGRILSRTGHEPIPYANIGIINSSVGTISNLDGSFSIEIPERFVNDTLHCSALGFGKRAIPIKFIRLEKELDIYLLEKITVLKSVTISAKKEKSRTFELGNRSFNGGVLETDTTYAGRSISLLIENREPNFQKELTFPVYLQKASLRIFKNNLNSFRFRVRLNDVDSLGMPGEDLLQQSIIMESTMRKGWLTFDLSHLNYQVTKPFFITFEQLLDLKDRTTIADGYRELMRQHPEWLKTDTVEFDGKKVIRQRIIRGGLDLPGTFVSIATSKSAQYSSFVRETSFAEWKKVRGIATATVTVSDQPVAIPTKTEKKDIVCDDNSAECQAEKLCRDFMDETGMNGLQLCVSLGNKIIFSTALGLADVQNGVPVTDSTRFRINSVSKAMTSTALIQLISTHRLELDSPVQKYIPDFPRKRYAITTRQAAGHLAGFRDYNENDPGDYIRYEHFDNAMQALKIFKNDTLLFKPGTRFSYSTFGWNLIGAIIESISGENYLDYMSVNIWKPLNLRNTCGDVINAKIPNRSKFYDAAGQENDLGDLSYKYSGGGLLSTAGDLIKFGNEMLRGARIDKLTRILFETQYTADKKETGYGLGWYTGKDKNGHRIWHHAGDSFSGSSFLVIYPDDDIVVAFLGNSQHGVGFDIEKIGELFYKK